MVSGSGETIKRSIGGIMTIDSIIQELREETQIAPGTLVEYEKWCAAQYAFYAGLLKDIEILKAKEWPKIRSEVKSDNQAEHFWHQRPEGIDEIGYKWELRRLQKLISACRSLLRVAEGESKLNY